MLSHVRWIARSCIGCIGRVAMSILRLALGGGDPKLRALRVLAQVRGDAVSSSFLRNEGGLYRVGFDQDAVRITRVACLTQGGGVVDIDAEAKGHGQTSPPYDA